MGLFGLGKKKNAPRVEVDEKGVGVVGGAKPSDRSGGLEKKVGDVEAPSKNSVGQSYGTKYNVKGEESKSSPPTNYGQKGVKGEEVKFIYNMRYSDPSKANQDPVDVVLIDCPIIKYAGRTMRISLEDLREIAFLPTDAGKLAEQFPYQGDKFEALYERKRSKNKR